MKKIAYALTVISIGIFWYSDAFAWDSTIGITSGTVFINGIAVNKSDGTARTFSSPTIPQNSNTTPYWDWLPRAYWNVSGNSFAGIPTIPSVLNVFSPLIYNSGESSPSPINAYGNYCIIKSNTSEEYRVIVAGLTPIPGEWTQTAWCSTGATYQAMEAIPSGFHLLENWDAIPPITPLVEWINGLTCQTDMIASLSGAVWNEDFWELPNVVNVDDPSVPDLSWGWFGTGGFNWDRDLTVISPAWTWSYLWTWSLIYPWTQTGIALDPTDWRTATVGIYSYRWGNPYPMNIVQIFWVENLAFWYAWSAVWYINYNDPFNIPLTASGWTTVFAVWNTNWSITTLWFQHLWRFNWFRMGRGPLIPKKSCSINFNICEWSYNWANLECQSAQNAAGVDFAGCGITWSGSIYWSGACVPLTDWSGAIIPPPPVTWWYVTYDSNGNIVGTVTPTVSGNTFFAWVFDCGINLEQDDWWKVIGKALICPITVVWNAINKIWGSVSWVQSWVNQIAQVSESISSGATAEVSHTWSYTGSNQLVGALMNIDERTSENFWFKYQKAWFYLFCACIMLGMIVVALKK